LRNVGALYYGCQFRPHTGIDSDSEDNPANFVHFENERRPIEGTKFPKTFSSNSIQSCIFAFLSLFSALSLPDMSRI